MNGKVLIVDDHPGIRLLLSEVLMYENYDVTTVSNGKEALSELENKSFSLILLDYELPIIDGLGVIKELNDQSCMTPTIVMSGRAEELDELRQYPFIKTVVKKPFDLLEIQSYIETFINE